MIILSLNTNNQIKILRYSVIFKLLFPMRKYLNILFLIFLQTFSIHSRVGANFYPFGILPTTLKCMINSGFSQFSTYGFFVNSVPFKSSMDIQNSHSSGADTNVIFKPCRGKPIEDQVGMFVSSINSDLYNYIWIQVQQQQTLGCYWNMHTPQENCNFLNELVNELRKTNKNIGILSHFAGWSSIFGNICTIGRPSLPLWNINLDNIPNLLTGFVPFGGWEYQSKKMYSTIPLCGVTIGASILY